GLEDFARGAGEVVQSAERSSRISPPRLGFAGGLGRAARLNNHLSTAARFVLHHRSLPDRLGSGWYGFGLPSPIALSQAIPGGRTRVCQVRCKIAQPGRPPFGAVIAFGEEASPYNAADR